MKVCSGCKTNKLEIEFYKRSISKDGLFHWCKNCARKYSLEHNEQVKLNKRNYYKRNKMRLSIDRSIYKKANKGITNASTAKRRTQKLQATPKWLTKEQYTEIKAWYILAEELQWLSNEPLQVDHIIPLQGENVSGLHVPWNLQILPQSLNASKGNKEL